MAELPKNGDRRLFYLVVFLTEVDFGFFKNSNVGFWNEIAYFETMLFQK